MAYFAEVENGIIKRIIVADQAFIDSGAIGDPETWFETDDSGTIRKNPGAVGYTYDKRLDAFIEPKPDTTWSLNETTYKWEAPIESPKDGKHIWNKGTQSWDEVDLTNIYVNTNNEL